MKIVDKRIHVSTMGNTDIRDLTEAIAQEVKSAGIQSGFVHLFVAGATGGITTIEYEPGLVEDLRQMFQRIVPEEGMYQHNRTHEDRNGHSHIRASLLGPSLTVPFDGGDLLLGKWQQVIFVDFDNRPREREILLRIVGAN